MKKLRAFSIQIEKYETLLRKDQIEILNEIKSLKSAINSIKKSKRVEKVSTDSLNEAIKDLRSQYNDNKVYYKVLLKHKNTKEKEEYFYDTRSEITLGILSDANSLAEKVKQSRSNKSELTQTRKRFKETNYNLVGLVHMKSNSISILGSADKIRTMGNYKSPLSEKNHVGVEIELYLKTDYETIKMELYKANPSLVDKVTVKDDGSLRPIENEKDFELAIIDTEENIKDTVIEVLSVLKNYSPRVDKACGLHVHLDMRNRIAEVCFVNLVKAQNLLYKMQKVDRTEGEFCKKTTHTNIYKYIMENRSRYMGINPIALKDHQTLEVRVHEGCFDSTLINNWIDLLIGIVNKKEKATKKYRSIKSICADFKIDKDIEAYAENRLTQCSA